MKLLGLRNMRNKGATASNEVTGPRSADVSSNSSVQITTDLSNQLPTARADLEVMLEPAWIRFRSLGISLEAGCSSTPDSPKSFGVSLLLIMIAILGVTSGLGGLTRWLGGPVWLCLSAAGVGLVVSTAFSTALVVRACRQARKEQL